MKINTKHPSIFEVKRTSKLTVLNQEKSWIKIFKDQLYVEIGANLTISCLSFFITYHFKGEDGVNEMVNNFVKQININDASLSYLGISLVLGTISYLIYHFFNTSYRSVFYKISNIYFNTIISLYRLIGSFLLGFSVLYITYESFSSLDHQVFSFIAFGLFSLLIITGLVIFLEKITKIPKH